MQTWRVGDVTITSLVETMVEMPLDGFLVGVDTSRLGSHLGWLRPAYLTEDNQLRVAIQALLVESEGKRIVVDTCLGNNRELPEPVAGLHTSFLEEADAIGFGREQVDYVLCTHLHTDHVGWNTMLVDGSWVPTWSRAQYIFSRAEFEFWQENSHPYVEMRDTVTPIVDAGLHELVDSDHALTGEVRLVPTPGHTPGHVSVSIDSRGERAMISGDIVHHPVQLVFPEWASAPDWDPAVALATRGSAIDELRNSRTLLIGTHFAEPAGGYVVAGDDGAVRFAAHSTSVS